jgi:hypothetical protein
VARRVGVDAQRLAGVGGAVIAQGRAQPQRAVVLPVEFRPVPDDDVKVHLLRDVVVGPGCLPQPDDLLERQGAVAFFREQDQPVTPALVVGAGRGRFVAWAVPVAEELAVELGQSARVGGVEHHLREPREVGHTSAW